MAKELPLRNEVKIEDTWDLTALYPSDEAWKEAGDKLEQELTAYNQYRGHLNEGKDILLEALRFDDCLGEQLERIYSYAHQKQDQDTTETKYQEFYGRAYELYTKILTASSFIQVELVGIGKDTLDKWMEEKEELRVYRRLFDLVLRQSTHTLSDKEEELLAKTHSFSAASSDIFKMFNNADLKFEPVADSEGKTYPLSHGTFIRLMESKDRTLRENAFTSLYNAYKKFDNSLAAMLSSKVKEYAFYGQVRHYTNPIECALYGNEIPIIVYNQLIEAVHEGLPAMYKYVSLRQKILGVEKLHLYDIYVPLVNEENTTYSFEEAKKLALLALAPMGEEYLALLKEGFAYRWIDVRENKGKRSGAYSTGCYGVHPYVLLNYNNSLDDVFTLVHEMGHSLHTWYSNSNQPYFYADYKIFVAEVASTCNEALLSHYLLEHAKTTEEKAQIINHFLDSIKGTIFRQTMFAEFEKTIHELVWKGESLTAERLNSIYHDLNVLYFGKEIVVDELIDREWARIPHFYTPFYVYQYATGLSAAIALSKKILTDKEEGVKAYKKFLKGGCSMSPIDLLKLAGVDMTTKEPVKQALTTFANLVEDLEKIQDKCKKDSEKM